VQRETAGGDADGEEGEEVNEDALVLRRPLR